MTKNMGSIDRIVRLLLAALVLVLYLTGTISGGWAIVLGVVAIIFALTSLVGVCPIYIPLKLSTRRKQDGTA